MSDESPNPPYEAPAEGVPTVRLPQQMPARRSGLAGWAVGLTGILALVLFSLAGLSLLLMRPGHPSTLAQVGTAVPTFTVQTTSMSAPPTATAVLTHTPQPSATPTTAPHHTQPTPTPAPTQAPTATATPQGTPTPVPTPTCAAPITQYGAPTTLHGDAVPGGSGFSATIGTLTVEIVVHQMPNGQGGCIPTDAQEFSIVYLANVPETSGSACTTPPHACFVQGTMMQTGTTTHSWPVQYTIDTGPFHSTVPGGNDTNPQQGSGQQCVSGQAFYLDNFGQQHAAAPAPQYCWNE